MNSDTVKGQVDELAGQAQKAYGQAKEQAQDTGKQLAKQVEQQPMIAVLVAGVVGFALGLLVARR